MIITIDGPAGSGKSTVARLLAQRLGFMYLDTGAFYRAFTWKVLKTGADLKNEEGLSKLVRNTSIGLEYTKDGLSVLVDGEDVTREIRQPEVTRHVHYIAGLAKVREPLVELQRKAAQGKDIVAEGRDTGTVVFPKANKKFYLDAKPEERAKRRYLESRSRNSRESYEEVLEDLRLRDERDSNRKVSPLRQDKDYTYLDTTGLGIEEVVNVLLKKIAP